MIALKAMRKETIYILKFRVPIFMGILATSPEILVGFVVESGTDSVVHSGHEFDSIGELSYF